MTVYKIPKRFMEDHAARGCLFAVEYGDLTVAEITVKETKAAIWVELTPAQASELLSDADHYGTSFADFGREFIGVCASGLATANALRKQGVKDEQVKGIWDATREQWVIQ